MKIFYIGVIRNSTKPAITLASAKDLSSFSFFERSVVSDFMGFFSQTIAERTPAGQRQSVERDETYIGHTYSRPEGVAGVIIADKEYPVRVAYTLINKILDEFLAQHPKSEWSREYPAGTKDPVVFKQLDTYIQTYQDPRQADSIMRVQQELDETKIVLHKTIESVLARGEKLDALVDKSEQLSNTSRQFYKQAKKTNSCCVIA